MNAITGKFGQQLSGIFKDSLECALTFTNWLKQWETRPICRNDMNMGVRFQEERKKNAKTVNNCRELLAKL